MNHDVQLPFQNTGRDQNVLQCGAILNVSREVKFTLKYVIVFFFRDVLCLGRSKEGSLLSNTFGAYNCDLRSDFVSGFEIRNVNNESFRLCVPAK